MNIRRGKLRAFALFCHPLQVSSAASDIQRQICLLLSVLAAHTVFAQSVEVLPETLISAPRGETIGGTAPIQQLLSPELESYGVDTLSDLVEALKPMTRSSRSDQTPVVLINGHLAGQAEFQTLPREAVERVEVLPETVALQYGFSENQRVLNFILRDHYHSIPAHVSDSGSAEGGNQTVSTDGSAVRLEQAARSTLYASYRDSAWLRDSQRGIEVPDSQDLTLQPAKTNVTFAGTISGLVRGVSSSLEGSLDVASSRSLQGLGEASSDLLQQGEHDVVGRLASQLTGQVGHAIWGATASFVRNQTDRRRWGCDCRSHVLNIQRRQPAALAERHTAAASGGTAGGERKIRSAVPGLRFG